MAIQDVNEMENRILEAAKLVFVRKGYEQTTMSDIASAAEIGRTALHYYFRTKQMLFDAIFEQLMDLLMPNIKRIMDGEGTILVKVPQIIDQYTAILQQNMLFPVFIINEMNRDPQHLYQTILKDPERLKPMMKLRMQVEEEMEQGIIRKMPLIDVISTLMSLIIFPLLIRNPLSTIFLDNNMDEFKSYINGHKELVKEVMLEMLIPKSKLS